MWQSWPKNHVLATATEIKTDKFWWERSLQQYLLIEIGKFFQHNQWKHTWCSFLVTVWSVSWTVNGSESVLDVEKLKSKNDVSLTVDRSPALPSDTLSTSVSSISIQIHDKVNKFITQTPWDYKSSHHTKLLHRKINTSQYYQFLFIYISFIYCHIGILIHTKIKKMHDQMSTVTCSTYG